MSRVEELRKKHPDVPAWKLASAEGVSEEEAEEAQKKQEVEEAKKEVEEENGGGGREVPEWKSYSSIEKSLRKQGRTEAAERAEKLAEEKEKYGFSPTVKKEIAGKRKKKATQVEKATIGAMEKIRGSPKGSKWKIGGKVYTKQEALSRLSKRREKAAQARIRTSSIYGDITELQMKGPPRRTTKTTGAITRTTTPNIRISKKAKKTYGKLSFGQRFQAEFRTATFTPRAPEYWAAQFGLGPRKPSQITQEVMTRELRAEKGLGKSFVRGAKQTALSPITTAPAMVGLGAGTTVALGKLSGAGAIAAEAGLGAVGLYSAGVGVKRAQKLYSRGETAKAAGIGISFGLTAASFYTGAKLGQRQVFAKRLGRAVAEKARGPTRQIKVQEKIASAYKKGKLSDVFRTTGKAGKTAKYFPKKGKFGQVVVKEYVRAGPRKGIRRTVVDVADIMKTPRGVPKPRKSEFFIKGEEPGYALVEPQTSFQRLGGRLGINVPRAAPTIGAPMSLIGGTVRTGRIPGIKEQFEIKGKMGQISKVRGNIGEVSGIKPVTKMKKKPKTRFGQVSKLDQPRTTKSALGQISAMKPKARSRIFKKTTRTKKMMGFGGFGRGVPGLIMPPLGFPKRKGKGKGISIPKLGRASRKGKYTPSLVGLGLGKSIPKPSKIVSGVGVRLPVKKKKKKKKGFGLKIGGVKL